MTPAKTASIEFSGSVAPLQARWFSRLGGLSACAIALFALSACSSLKSVTDNVSRLASIGNIGNIVTPYKVEVVQGNFVSQEQKDALQIGMPRAQVRDILGSPLVASAFHADRWDYVFTIVRQGQAPQQRKLTVYFKGDELAKVESDELITEEAFVTSLSVGRNIGKVPLLEVPPEVLREFGIKNSTPNTVLALTNAAQSATNTVALASYPALEAPGAITSAWDASTLRAVAASNAARPSTSAAAANAPLLNAQAPLLSAAPSASAPASAATPAATPAATSAAAPVATPQPATAAPAPRVAAAAASSAVIPAPLPAPIPAPSVRPAPAAPAPQVTAAPPPPPPAPAPSASTLASADPDITTFLNRWTSDWQARNAAAYFSHYLPEFTGTSATRAEWEALRRTRIEGRSRISLGVFDVRVRMVSPTEARLVFRQDYDSDAFKEVGTKAMFLVKRDGRWLVEREFFTPAAQ
jgi:outer membrane protein assembly factor BamE